MQLFFRNWILSVFVVSSIIATSASAQNVTFPTDFFAERLQGSACSKFFSSSRLNSDIKMISALSSASMTSTNSLNVNHDAFSKRWTKLLEVSYGAAAKGDATAGKKIMATLVSLAQANALLNAPSYNSARKVQCWKGGRSDRPCPLHVVQHTGYTGVAMLYSAIVLEEFATPDQKRILDTYFDKIYKKFISPLASNGSRSDGLYEFGDYGLGVLAYARWKRDARLAKSEIRKRRSSFIKKIDAQGMLKENSFRGYRGYWYHTLGAESAFGYALVARSFGTDFFKDAKLGPRFQNLANQTVSGGRSYSDFRERALQKSPKNAIKDPNAEIPHMHQFAVGLPIILKREYGYGVTTASAYKSKGRLETISKITGFNADCYYSSFR
ncbi:hypothetical protein [Ruegeria conchae]|uniref:hypothetical protein n=1 Tax=Ruegeria conchae TaxID=981384 RepID=UPI0029C95161|nr:hypothetical protein [Ruegeria conchae]